MRDRNLLVIVLLVLLFGLGGCGDEATPSPTATTVVKPTEAQPTATEEPTPTPPRTPTP